MEHHASAAELLSGRWEAVGPALHLASQGFSESSARKGPSVLETSKVAVSGSGLVGQSLTWFQAASRGMWSECDGGPYLLPVPPPPYSSVGGLGGQRWVTAKSSCLAGGTFCLGK